MLPIDLTGSLFKQSWYPSRSMDLYTPVISKDEKLYWASVSSNTDTKAKGPVSVWHRIGASLHNIVTLRIRNLLWALLTCQHPNPLSHLCKIEVHQAEGEELEAHGEAVEQPEGEGCQGVGRDKVLEVEREEYGAQGRPQQAQGQEGGLVAEALVAVPQHQPELDVDEDEEEGVEDGIDHRQAQSDVRRHGRAQGRKRHGLVHQRRLLSCHRGLHDLLSPTWKGGGSGAEGQVFLRSHWVAFI